MTVTRLNPHTLHHNPAFTQVVVVESPVKIIYVGGQNALNNAGILVGQDIASQTTQAMKNLNAALDAAGGSPKDVIKMTIYIVQGQPLHEAFAAFQAFQGRVTNPPTISVLIVAGLANPEFLIEIEAVAAS